MSAWEGDTWNNEEVAIANATAAYNDDTWDSWGNEKEKDVWGNWRRWGEDGGGQSGEQDAHFEAMSTIKPKAAPGFGKEPVVVGPTSKAAPIVVPGPPTDQNLVEEAMKQMRPKAGGVVPCHVPPRFPQASPAPTPPPMLQTVPPPSFPVVGTNNELEEAQAHKARTLPRPVQALEKERAEATQRAEVAEAHVQQYAAALEQLRTQLHEMEQQRNEPAEVQALRQQLAESIQLRAQESRQRAQEAERSAFELQQASLRARTVDQAVQEQRNVAQETHQRYQHAMGCVSMLEEQVRKLQAELSTANANANAATAASKRAEEAGQRIAHDSELRVATIQAQAESMKSRVEAAEALAATLEGKHREIVQRAETAEQRAGALQADADRSKQELQRAQDELQRARAQVLAAHSALLAVKVAANEASAAANQAATNAVAALDALGGNVVEESAPPSSAPPAGDRPQPMEVQNLAGKERRGNAEEPSPKRSREESDRQKEKHKDRRDERRDGKR